MKKHTFNRIEGSGTWVTIQLDGESLPAVQGEPLAVAILCHSTDALRTSAHSCSPRSPYCLIGSCFECLATVDGRANVQTCLIEVCAGMRVNRQAGKREFG